MRYRGLGLPTLTKPVKQSDLVRAIVAAVSAAPAGLEVCDSAPQPVSPGRLRVLVAEDNPVNQKLAVRLSPGDFLTVHGADIVQHFAVLRALWPTDVPSPEPLWLETDQTVL